MFPWCQFWLKYKLFCFIFHQSWTTLQGVSRIEGATTCLRKHHGNALSRTTWMVFPGEQLNPCLPLQNQSQHLHTVRIYYLSPIHFITDFLIKAQATQSFAKPHAHLHLLLPSLHLHDHPFRTHLLSVTATLTGWKVRKCIKLIKISLLTCKI